MLANNKFEYGSLI